MASLHYLHGTMNSGKSMELLKVAHNYEEQGKNVIVLSPSVDDRSGVGTVSSRIGLSRDVIPVDEDDDLTDLVRHQEKRISCVLVDEAQFLSRDQVLDLTSVTDDLVIPVMAFGLKNDFQNRLFPGSEALLIYADKVRGLKTICWVCERKATMNLRVNEQGAELVGDQVEIGGNDRYLPVCRKHYHDAVQGMIDVSEFVN